MRHCTQLLLYVLVATVPGITDELAQNDTETQIASSKPGNSEEFPGFRKVGNEFRLTFHDNYLTCADLQKLGRTGSQLATGWSKTVFEFLPKTENEDFGRNEVMESVLSQDLVLKLPNYNGETAARCTEKMRREICNEEVRKLVIDEIVNLDTFRSKSVIPMIGYCIPVKGDPMILVPRGLPLDHFVYYQMPWERRFQLLSNAVSLLLAVQPKPVRMADLKLDQFVVLNSTMVLGDADHFQDCTELDDCEAANAAKVGDLFAKPLLADAPRPLTSQLAAVLTDLQQTVPNLVEITRVLAEMKTEFAALKSALPDNHQAYSALRNTSLSPSTLSNECSGTHQRGSCVVSVTDVRDASALCSTLDFCRGFVWSQHSRSWTGRFLIRILDVSDLDFLESSMEHVTYLKSNQSLNQ